MLLIDSKFRDYYDSGAAYGVDKTCVYHRVKSEVELKYDSVSYGISHVKNNVDVSEAEGDITIEFMVVGFCGKIYPLVIFKDKTSKYFFYKADEYIDHLKKIGKVVAKTNKRRWMGINSRNATGRYINSFFSMDLSYLDGLFRKHKTPIFTIRKAQHNKLTLNINDNLDQCGFQKIKNTYSAFQGVYMYMSGVLGNTEIDIVGISDEDMLFKKGFDSYSFKTPKGSPNRKRKKSK